MKRIAMVAALAAMVCVGRSAQAQPPRPSSSNDVRKLEAELEALKSVLKDVEAKLNAAKKTTEKKGEEKKPEGRRGFGPPGFGGGRPGMPFGPGSFGRGFPGKPGEKKPEAGKSGDKKPEFGRGGPGGRGPGMHGRHGKPGDKKADEKKPGDKKPEFGRGPGGRPSGDKKPEAKGSDVEKRLDRLFKDLEDLRKELKKK